METQLMDARRARGWSQLRVVVELESRGVRRRVAMPSRTSLKTQLSRRGRQAGLITPSPLTAGGTVSGQLLTRSAGSSSGLRPKFIGRGGILPA